MSKKKHQLFTRARRAKLSPREAEIVAELAIGEKRDTVAAALKIARGTLNTHLERAFRKLGVHSIQQAVFFLS